ncbi:MarR family winged helix-turn-helix transcriptional regulator [Roseburia sp. 499]|uniref:MarR family winged helix-turn-helix transcriptional regulator n=1 Tax=Roseburia sp. 499 TaxID=1261634 RepID=UPI00095254A4|nr:MarR family transcriptional regulator [Roseburia sp. 499]WVK70602.1 MarR family transcriptional regulator [Roseburia sp. 499]
MNTTDFLVNIRRTIKLHESMLKEICEKHQLTLIEANIISFLHNNPQKDTAGDIVELRMLSKGNVSGAVESLIQKSLLQRKPDLEDRRKIHLLLLPKAKVITDEVEACKKQFQKEIFLGMSEQEKKQFEELNRLVMENTKNAMKRRENK